MGTAEIRWQDRLRSRVDRRTELLERDKTRALISEWVGAGALCLLVGVSDGAVQQVPDPPVEPDVDPSSIAEVGVGHLLMILPASGQWVAQGERSRRRHGEIVLVVGGQVENHVIA